MSLTQLLLVPVAILAVWLLRQWAKGGQVRPEDLSRDMAGLNVIVTGGNSGIGFETALQLAKQGATVFIASRQKQAGEIAVSTIREQSKNDQVYFEHLDLASLQAVRDFASRWKNRNEPIDILINNAGVMALPKRTLTVDGNEIQMATNHLGHFLLTELLLGHLERAVQARGSARIINLSSIAHYSAIFDADDLNSERNTYGPHEVYSNTKLANILYTRNLAKRLNNSGITVNAAHPGVVRTPLFRYNRAILRLLFFVLEPVIAIFFKTPWEGCQTTLHLALSDAGKTTTGKYFADCREAGVYLIYQRLFAAISDELVLETKLVENSKRLVGL
ncbi:uncharacterized protein BJ171DRAFT_582114 [Polychytrium aggregatum]|uniref:uncharacterized protein n=1 Tax=Polychytrium aggregatum TaxID=110093 RepID=UPI0022FE6558|nr:uncharacterized protein BJ171DRAFT_582114 [Polychytrium aggregatum]KAI9204138.1 hypothetical protein BJ171DRAFT_582114 [Polychytrium aggregatum]